MIADELRRHGNKWEKVVGVIEVLPPTWNALCELVEAVEHFDTLQEEVEQSRPDLPDGLLTKLIAARDDLSAALAKLKQTVEEV